MPRLTSLVLLAALAALPACGPDSSTYTVAYYKAHRDERKEKLAQCRNDPGGLRNDALCINAHEADFSDSVGDLRKLPPLGLEEAAEEYKREELKRLEADKKKQAKP